MCLAYLELIILNKQLAKGTIVSHNCQHVLHLLVLFVARYGSTMPTDCQSWLWCGIMGRWLLCSQVLILDGGSQDSQSRLPTSIKNFKMSQKEKTLDELVRDRWLSYTSAGKIGLGIRSFLDLRSWFRGNDIPSCVVCNEACIKVLLCNGYMFFTSLFPVSNQCITFSCCCDYCLCSQQASSCPNEGCNIRIHEYCLKKKFPQRKVDT